MEVKMCAYHKVEHPVSEFGTRLRSPDGLEAACKERRNFLMREYRKVNKGKPRPPEQIFAYNLKRNYGITPEKYNEMIMAQCGLCAICGQPEVLLDPRTGETRRLSVHHNHETGKVLALCCSECNMGMGKLKDSAILLRRAADLMDEEVLQ